MYHLQNNRCISALNEPCLQTLLLAGALDCKAESYTGQRQWNSLQCSPVHGSGPGPTAPTQTNRRGANHRSAHPPTKGHTQSTFSFHSVCLTFVSLSVHPHIFSHSSAYRGDRCAWCLLCQHGFVMRSPGSWLGGSWVSALRLFCLAPPGHLLNVWL